MNRRTKAVVFFGALLTAVTSIGAQAPPAAAQATTPKGLVIQVGLDLIQIDASITDSKGRPVTDLKAADLQLTVDGKKQPLTNAAFFGATDADGNVASPAAADRDDAVKSPDTLVFVVDDLDMSFASMYAARRGLARFAANWESPAPMMALRAISDDSPNFTVFRSLDRLQSAIDSLKYNMRSSKGVRSVSPSQDGNLGQASTRSVSLKTATEQEMASNVNPTMALANLESRVSNLVSTINSLRSLPGRKAVVFVSEGFYVANRPQDLARGLPFSSLFDDRDIEAGMRIITEVANRASVVLYTVDPRGLETDELDISRPYPGPAAASAQRLAQWQARVGSQQSLSQIAGDTGGMAIVNTNGIKEGLEEILRDHAAYYLVGFEPPPQTFDRKSGRPKFHNIKLTVNRPGVQVRTRAGFYGITDAEVLNKVPLPVAPSH